MSLFANHNCHMNESWEVTSEVGLGSGFGYFAKILDFIEVLHSPMQNLRQTIKRV